MATPKVNLIPVGYYERRKARAAAWLTGLALAGVVFGLLGYSVVLQNHKKDLEDQQAYWQAEKDKIDALNAKASDARATVADVATKVKFVNDCFIANASWTNIFTGLVAYSHPNVQFTNIKPVANSPAVTMKIRTPSQVVLNQFWANILRSPIVKTAAPSQMLGGGVLAPVGQAADTTSTEGAPAYTSSMPGMPMPGGPTPMPGSGMPGMPMPGGPSPMGPQALSPIGRANQLSAETMNGTLGSELGQQLLGADGQPIVGVESLPPSLLQQFRTPTTYEVDVSAIITNPVKLPTFGGQTVPTEGQTV
jgi:Tfp pilus assembly protein PilN